MAGEDISVTDIIAATGMTTGDGVVAARVRGKARVRVGLAGDVRGTGVPTSR